MVDSQIVIQYRDILERSLTATIELSGLKRNIWNWEEDGMGRGVCKGLELMWSEHRTCKYEILTD